MKRYINTISLFIFLNLAAIGAADTFKHKESGEVFTGFVTQKSSGGKTLVYNSEESKMTPIIQSDYNVTMDRKGRRDTVSLFRLTQPEILLSESISKNTAKAIVDASNKGPQAIIIQIDSPGGRGKYMKHIALAVSQTDNCPVYAFISGDVFGGAFSSAAMVALACDMIYIKTGAGMGAVGPAVEGLADQGYGNFLNTFSPASLVTFTGMATTFAEKNARPAVLTKAMIDKSLSVVQVANLDGSADFVKQDGREQSQTLVRSFSEGMSAEALADLSTVTEVEVVGKVVNLTAQQAIETGLADKLAGSIDAVLADQDMESLKVTLIPGIEAQIKKYLAAKRNIAERLMRIESQEEMVETLNEQFTGIDTHLRTGMNTREVAKGASDSLYRSNRNRYQSSDYFNDYYIQSSGVSRSNRKSSKYQTPTQQRVTVSEPSADIQVVYQQLGSALQELIEEYRRTVNLSKRWPGALPIDMSVASLQQYMDSAENELEKLRRYQPPYLQPVQFQQNQLRRNKIRNPNRY